MKKIILGAFSFGLLFAPISLYAAESANNESTANTDSTLDTTDTTDNSENGDTTNNAVSNSETDSSDAESSAESSGSENTNNTPSDETEETHSDSTTSEEGDVSETTLDLDEIPSDESNTEEEITESSPSEINKQDLIKLLVTESGIEINTDGGPHYYDVAQGSEYYNYVETAFNAKIITVPADGSFHGTENVAETTAGEMFITAFELKSEEDISTTFVVHGFLEEGVMLSSEKNVTDAEVKAWIGKYKEKFSIAVSTEEVSESDEIENTSEDENEEDCSTELAEDESCEIDDSTNNEAEKENDESLSAQGEKYTEYILPKTEQFPDVEREHANVVAIDYLKKNGIVNGFDDGSFKPENKISRAAFTKIIIGAQFSEEKIKNCIAEQGLEDSNTVFFSDVPQKEWFAPYVCVAKVEGIVNGFGDGTYGPDKNIAFPAAAKILAETFGYQIEKNPNEDWYKPYIRIMGQKKSIPTSIDSLEYQITRGEMAELLWRLKEEISEEDSKSADDLLEAI